MADQQFWNASNCIVDSDGTSVTCNTDDEIAGVGMVPLRVTVTMYGGAQYMLNAFNTFTFPGVTLINNNMDGITLHTNGTSLLHVYGTCLGAEAAANPALTTYYTSGNLAQMQYYNPTTGLTLTGTCTVINMNGTEALCTTPVGGGTGVSLIPTVGGYTGDQCNTPTVDYTAPSITSITGATANTFSTQGGEYFTITGNISCFLQPLTRRVHLCVDID
jgi:hypothetical protein